MHIGDTVICVFFFQNNLAYVFFLVYSAFRLRVALARRLAMATCAGTGRQIESNTLAARRLTIELNYKDK